MRVILASSLKAVNDKFAATVEAEYGATVIKGEKITLAHHAAEYRHCPAPCNNPDAKSLEEGDSILVSHLDLDTVGGVLALMGNKPEMAHDFWALAEYIDLNGPHHLNLCNFSQTAKDQLVAVWAWNFKNRAPRRDINVAHDVTEDIQRWGSFLHEMSLEDIEEGRKWIQKTTQDVEKCLVWENSEFRVFSSTGPFCNAAYYSSRKEAVVPAVITYNRSGGFAHGSITISFASANDNRNACGIMQNLFGKLAGGHKGIAGSPRGKCMARTECMKIARFILGNKCSRREVVRLALKLRSGR